MNYNEVFRVFDNGGETVDRYTVFLSDDPSQGALGLSDDPTNPSYGFSQFGDFDLHTVDAHNNEITFDALPEDVQQHVIDRFGLKEATMSKVVLEVASGNKEGAKSVLGKLIEGKIERLIELKTGGIKFVGDDVLVGGTKVGEIQVDLEDHSRGIVLRLLNDGGEQEFDDIKSLVKFLADKFRLKESAVMKEVLQEATLKQKAVVKGLRQLARKLEIPKPRFRSSGGKSEFIELSLRDWKENSLPNDLRKKAVVKVMNNIPDNFEDVNRGGIRGNAMTMTADQWLQLLAHYGIDVPELMNEGFQIMPDIDRERYRDRSYDGLEGPFRARNGKVVYYDPKEGKYYDPDSDMYISFEEWEEMDRDHRMMRP